MVFFLLIEFYLFFMKDALLQLDRAPIIHHQPGFQPVGQLLGIADGSGKADQLGPD